MKTCPSCNSSVDRHATSCAGCGYRFEQDHNVKHTMMGFRGFSTDEGDTATPPERSTLFGLPALRPDGEEPSDVDDAATSVVSGDVVQEALRRTAGRAEQATPHAMYTDSTREVHSGEIAAAIAHARALKRDEESTSAQPKTTMFGVPGIAAGGPTPRGGNVRDEEAAGDAAPAGGGSVKSTMFGVPAVMDDEHSKSGRPVFGSREDPSAAPVRSTMFGLPAITDEDEPGTPFGQAGRQAPPNDPARRTAFGMPNPLNPPARQPLHQPGGGVKATAFGMPALERHGLEEETNEGPAAKAAVAKRAWALVDDSGEMEPATQIADPGALEAMMGEALPGPAARSQTPFQSAEPFGQGAESFAQGIVDDDEEDDDLATQAIDARSLFGDIEFGDARQAGARPGAWARNTATGEPAVTGPGPEQGPGSDLRARLLGRLRADGAGDGAPASSGPPKPKFSVPAAGDYDTIEEIGMLENLAADPSEPASATPASGVFRLPNRQKPGQERQGERPLAGLDSVEPIGGVASVAGAYQVKSDRQSPLRDEPFVDVKPVPRPLKVAATPGVAARTGDAGGRRESMGSPGGQASSGSASWGVQESMPEAMSGDAGAFGHEAPPTDEMEQPAHVTAAESAGPPMWAEASVPAQVANPQTAEGMPMTSSPFGGQPVHAPAPVSAAQPAAASDMARASRPASNERLIGQLQALAGLFAGVLLLGGALVGLVMMGLGDGVAVAMAGIYVLLGLLALAMPALRVEARPKAMIYGAVSAVGLLGFVASLVLGLNHFTVFIEFGGALVAFFAAIFPLLARLVR